MNKENYSYIFDELPQIKDSNIQYLANIENNYKQNGFIKEEDVNAFLDYFISEVRKKVSFPLEPTSFSYKGCCSRAQSILHEVFIRMGFKSYGFNVGKMFTEDKLIHELDLLIIPVLKDDEVINKAYILDPTFRQFCIDEENRFERYYEEPRYSVRMSTPHPGYFLNMDDNRRLFANELIKNGYFELTEDSIKTYFDSFVLYLTPKENYKDISLLGKIKQTDFDSNYYVDLINKSFTKYQLPPRRSELINTPIEVLEKSQKKGFFSRFKWNNNIDDNFEIPSKDEIKRR